MDREELLDELARVFARAAVDALLAEPRIEKAPTESPSVEAVTVSSPSLSTTGGEPCDRHQSTHTPPPSAST
jgi:hypothetical protein